MDDRDETLADYDLSAWEAPPPAANLADAVIARAKQPAAAAALDADERPRKRWWIAGGVALAMAAAVGIGMWGVKRVPASGSGELVAERAQRLELGPSSAELDPGTQIAWRRDRHKLVIAQPRGTAMWNVDAEDTVVIDAGAMGASVEATGASLRVEVEMMNRSDVRAIGMSAATAITVALVTVIVYEGHVKVSSGGQTVNVGPGAALELRPEQPPKEQLSVGVSAAELEAKNNEIARLEAEIQRLEDAQKRTVDDSTDKVLGRAAISAVMDPLRDQILACPTSGYTGSIKLEIGVLGSGAVDYAHATTTGGKDITVPLYKCVTKIARAAVFPASTSGATFSYPYTYGPACDADALKAKGDDHLQTGMDAAALAAFEASMKCKPDASIVRLAFMAACRSRNASKAKLYYGKLDPTSRKPLAAICTRNGIDVESTASAPACDAEALAEQAYDLAGGGKDAEALPLFEASLKCKAHPLVNRFALMSACRAKDEAKAKRYFARLEPDSGQDKIREICIRDGVDPAATAKAAACDADALKAKGDDHLQTGMDAAALAAFEASLKCKPDPALYRLALMAACRSKNAPKAKLYYKKLPRNDASARIAQICVRNSIDVE